MTPPVCPLAHAIPTCVPIPLLLHDGTGGRGCPHVSQGLPMRRARWVNVESSRPARADVVRVQRQTGATSCGPEESRPISLNLVVDRDGARLACLTLSGLVLIRPTDEEPLKATPLPIQSPALPIGNVSHLRFRPGGSSWPSRIREKFLGSMKPPSIASPRKRALLETPRSPCAAHPDCPLFKSENQPADPPAGLKAGNVDRAEPS